MKTEPRAAYRALDRVLTGYRDLLTCWRDGGVQDGAVTVLVTGNADPSLLTDQRVRYAGYDGRLPDLGLAVDPALMPVVSDDWRWHFGWRGVGPMPADERAQLRGYVDIAHERGHRLRFWGTPDEPEAAQHAVWREQLTAGVDYLSTDDLAGLRAFLTDRER